MEMRGVEPLSEDRLVGFSPVAVNLWISRHYGRLTNRSFGSFMSLYAPQSLGAQVPSLSTPDSLPAGTKGRTAALLSRES